jgi:predicted RNA binding protein with dsRBD fold (UPF0201 family)
MSEVYSVAVEVTAAVNETEVRDRVEDAILNLFPGADVEYRHGELVGTTHTMARFAEQLRDQEILDTARKEFRENRRGDTFTFALKKQAAFEGVINFAVGDPAELGDLHVSVRVDQPDVDTFVDEMAPPTEEGVPVDEDR